MPAVQEALDKAVTHQSGLGLSIRKQQQEERREQQEEEREMEMEMEQQKQQQEQQEREREQQKQQQEEQEVRQCCRVICSYPIFPSQFSGAGSSCNRNRSPMLRQFPRLLSSKCLSCLSNR